MPAPKKNVHATDEVTSNIQEVGLTRTTTRAPRNGTTAEEAQRTVSLMTYPLDQVKSDQGNPSGHRRVGSRHYTDRLTWSPVPGGKR